MKKNKPQILIDNDTIFLTLDLKGLGLYDRGKAIRQFINSDTKIVEDYCDTLIRGIFRRNGINIQANDKSVLKEAFDTLKAKNKEIEIIDFYKNSNMYHCEIIETTKMGMTILLEDNRFLQCGVTIKEKDLCLI